MASRIEWTQETWNPVTGCTKVSSGSHWYHVDPADSTLSIDHLIAVKKVVR